MSATRVLAALIGPRVCELDDPNPILKNSKRVVFMRVTSTATS